MKRISALGAALALLLAVTAGCGGQDKKVTELDTAAAVTLTWWTGQASADKVALEALAAEYTEHHPNVTIKTSRRAPRPPTTCCRSSPAGFAGGSYPDISYAFGSWAGRPRASGKTQDLTDYVADPSFAGTRCRRRPAPRRRRRTRSSASRRWSTTWR